MQSKSVQTVAKQEAVSDRSSDPPLILVHRSLWRRLARCKVALHRDDDMHYCDRVLDCNHTFPNEHKEWSQSRVAASQCENDMEILN